MFLENRKTIPNRITYAGQQYDSLTGQYYLRARYYNPVIGRFTQEDPFRGDGLNLYAYVSNNPLSYYDPTGYSKCDVSGESNDNWWAKIEEWYNNSFKPWLNDDKPTIPFYIPESGELISNFFGALAGTGLGTASKLEKLAKAFINENGFLQMYPKGAKVKYLPFENLGKVATGITVASLGLDIGNTWSEDNGNTNLKRLEKTGIQLAGAGLSAGVGILSGKLIAAGTAGIPASGGMSLLLVPVAFGVDLLGSVLIDAGQEWTYDQLDIN